MLCGLLGRKLGHSYSPQIHSRLGDYPYKLFEKEPEELEAFLRDGSVTGLNVTVPYKKAVIPFCDCLSPIAQRLGAVNTLVRRSDGTLIGHNSDYFGFQTMIRSSGLSIPGKKCLVLGSGGASNTAVAVLEELGAQVVVISRTGENNYQNLHLHSDAALIVNTTPVGMYPDTGLSPVDLGCFPTLEGVLDVIYNPARTKLLLDAERRGLIAVNGLLMLVAQAKESAEWFTGNAIHNSRITEIHRSLRLKMENIILIGMPGCGKSTVGKLLAEKLGKTFVDADDEIVTLAGKSIPEIFSQDGEDAFRQWETKALEALGKRSGLVIATGGGCVTRARNYPLLHQNGTIFWFQRDLNRLPTDGRPLSQKTDLSEMYRIRQPLYEQFADCVVDNNGSLESSLDRILGVLEVMK
ncbi:MAG: shikimate kinase [Oscillospiraceae bacterium]|nr:shikimate kinase [Oscillospiraceae bacterium]